MYTIKNNSINEIIIKNSKFITLLYKVYSKEDIKTYLKEVKNLYPNATHYCYAYILNNEKKSSSKNFYIILKCKNKNKEIINFENFAIEDLNDKYFKIKECLSRCGNVVTDVNSKEEVINILFYFMNSRMYLNEYN